MVEELTTSADEGSSLDIGPLVFKDSEPKVVTLKTCTWRLTDLDGNVINSRSAEDALAETDSSGSVTIHLEGDDLAITDVDEMEMATVKRRLRVSWTCDTTIRGVLYSDYPGTEEFEITINNHRATDVLPSS